MIKKTAMALGLVVMGGIAVGCSAAPVDEGGETETEEVATESAELPCQDCGGEGGGYEPYYPYDGACGYGESKWNSGADCGPSAPCSTGGTGCSTVTYRCGSNGCGSTTNSTSTNPCYGKAYYSTCTASGGNPGHCKYNWANTLVCFAD